MAEEAKKEKTDKRICGSDKIIAGMGESILTDEYVAQSGKTWGNEFYKCIFLRDISSTDYGYKSYPLLLVLAVLLFIVFLANTNEPTFLIGAIICVVAFFLTRKNAVIISAHNKDTIVQPLGQKKAEAKDFVEKIIKTKKNFIK